MGSLGSDWLSLELNQVSLDIESWGADLKDPLDALLQAFSAEGDEGGYGSSAASSLSTPATPDAAAPLRSP